MDAKKQQNKKEPPFKERFKMNCNEAAHQIKLAKEEAIAHRRYIDEQADNFIRLINAKSDDFSKQLEIESERGNVFLNEILDSVKNGDISRLEKITSKPNEVK